MNLQEHIRRILREESRVKNLINRNVNKYGLYQTSKMLGLTQTKIIELGEILINSEIANELIDENLYYNKLTKKYKGFHIDTDSDGVVHWMKRRKSENFLSGMMEQIDVVATPFWDGMEYTPVEIDWFTLYYENTNPTIDLEGEGKYYKTFNSRTLFDSVEDLFNWYETEYLPEVYNIIMNDLLPEVYRDVNDKLN